MDAKYFEEIKAREQSATPGPWRISGDIDHLVCAEESPEKYDRPPIVADCGHLYNASNSFHVRQMQDNAAFIAHARTDIPALIAEAERLQNEVWKKELAFGQLTHYNAAKDQQIAVLNAELQDSHQDHIDDFIRLKTEIATLKKALELACERLEQLGKMDGCESAAFEIEHTFIRQAQEQEKKNE